MRHSNLLFALPALATAQGQFPFVDQVKGWFAQASASVSSAVPSAPSGIPNPLAAGAAKFADLSVTRLTLDNWQDVLKPGAATASPGAEEWMIFVTGGNTTCFGMCGRAETAWNESVALLEAAPSTPNLAMLSCETEPVLCQVWMISPPQVIHMLLPQPLPDQSLPSSTVRYISVNRTTVTAPQIAALHLQEKYKETAPYEGAFHPFDGALAKYNLALPVGYAVWAFGKVPSWAFMIVISFVSRNVMSRRMARTPGIDSGRNAPPAPAAAAPAGQRR